LEQKQKLADRERNFKMAGAAAGLPIEKQANMASQAYVNSVAFKSCNQKTSDMALNTLHYL
jgi:hypothetical protein